MRYFSTFLVTLCLTLIFVSARAQEIDKGIPASELIQEYKVKKHSPSPICKSAKVFKFVRLKKAADADDQTSDNDLIPVVASSLKEVEAGKPESYSMGPFLDWAGDLNEDGFTDLLVNYWPCTISGCSYELLAHCGSGRYASLFTNEDNRATMYEPLISKTKTVVKNEKWRNIQTTVRTRDVLEGCDSENFDFLTPLQLTFDGTNYTVTDAESKKFKKLQKQKAQRIKKACAKTHK